MFYIKQNDTSPAFRITLKDAAGTAVNVTGATVRFHMTDVEGVTPKVDAAGVLVTAASGIVEYQWATGDTEDVGVYNAEFEVTFVDGTIETWPNNGYLKVKVTAELA